MSQMEILEDYEKVCTLLKHYTKAPSKRQMKVIANKAKRLALEIGEYKTNLAKIRSTPQRKSYRELEESSHPGMWDDRH